ncbi:TPA: hypothetical protein ACPFJF_004178 [Pseudomonas aeruginosa]|uniref:hypothetical protein n=1 Tax=Pseudomonas aeruginosa TaxID=287 RepID=UPI003ACF57A0
MSAIAIVYFSGYGHTARLAEAVREGAQSVPGSRVSVHAIDPQGELPGSAWKALEEADAIVYGSPTYMGGPAGSSRSSPMPPPSPGSSSAGRTRWLPVSPIPPR